MSSGFRNDSAEGISRTTSKGVFKKLLSSKKVASGEIPPDKSPSTSGNPSSSSTSSASGGFAPRPASPRSFFPRNRSADEEPRSTNGAPPNTRATVAKQTSLPAVRSGQAANRTAASGGGNPRSPGSADQVNGSTLSAGINGSCSQPSIPEDAPVDAEGASPADDGGNAGGNWETIEPPEEFVCPLSLEIMFDPVIVSSGQTYERAFIARWIREGHTTCPKTRQPLDSTAIFPNQVLKVMINDWCKQNGVPPPTPRDPTDSLNLSSADLTTLPQPLRRSREAAESAARAMAVAMESERRQRALLERMAADRGRPSPAAAGNATPRRQASRRRQNSNVNGDAISIASLARIGSNAGGLGSIGGIPSSGSMAGVSLDNITFSMGSFNPDQPLAGWPGQLAMQASIFRRLMVPPSVAPEEGDTESVADGTEAGQDEAASVSGTPARRPGEYGRVMSRQGSARSTARDVESGRYTATFSYDGSEMGDSHSVTTGASELQMVDVEELVQSITSGAPEDQAAGAALLRVMTRHGFKHQKKVVAAGAVGPLISLMRASDEPTVEHAATTLMNLSLDERLKPKIGYEVDIITNLVHVLKNGMPQARANAAAAFFCLSTLDGLRERIVEEGAVAGLVKLLEEGAAAAKKDAANCIVSLCMSKENRRAIAQSGAVAVLCGLVREGVEIVEEQTAAIFAAIVRDAEGRTILFEEGAIPALAELVEGGASSRCREYCVNALLGLAVNSKACLAAIDEEGISASIDVLTRTGSTKTQAKATALLELLRQYDTAGGPQ